MEQRSSTTRAVFWVLRAGTAMCMIGHGALGIGRAAPWTAYFAVVGIHRAAALELMPLVGVCDVSLGLVILFWPARAAALYAATWALWTALLRPLAGEGAWEAVERAGNYGAPFALYLMARADGPGSWLRGEPLEALAGVLLRNLGWTLRVTTALLLLGHGLLGAVVHKPILGAQYAHIGLAWPWVEPALGGFECALALAVLLSPGFALLLFVAAWKIATEALSPISGSPVWVFVEHGGSYAAPIALALLVRGHSAPRREPSGEAAAPVRGTPALSR